MRSGGHHLDDTDTFALPSANTTNELIPDKSVASMSNGEHLEQGIHEFFVELLSADARQSFTRSFCRKSKLKSLFNSKRRDMNVIWKEPRISRIYVNEKTDTNLLGCRLPRR
jgi:hypothetical protein